jgi:hypothetical protein
MPSLWFVVPACGRAKLARICLRQLRRTCDALTDNGVDATAVVIADDANLKTARSFGFATVKRNNDFLSAKFNDGIQLAMDRPLPPRDREPTHGEYRVTGRRDYRGNKPGSTFVAKLDRGADARAVYRRDIELLRRITPSLIQGSYTLPDGWPANRAADYVVPCGSDDWVDWRVFTHLPSAREVFGFQFLSVVREDGREMVVKHLRYAGGSGIRVYPRHVMRKLNYRPADEDRGRGCDTSILTNLSREGGFTIVHRDTDPRQIVDWKSPSQQLNGYEDLRRHQTAAEYDDPFAALADVYPAEALREMRAHYGVREAVFA